MPRGSKRDFDWLYKWPSASGRAITGHHRFQALHKVVVQRTRDEEFSDMAGKRAKCSPLKTFMIGSGK